MRSVVQDFPIGRPPAPPPSAAQHGHGGSGPERASVALDRPYALAFALCAIATLAPMWLFKYVPMLDLPQHAFQMYIWLHRDTPGLAGLYHENWFTPYLLGYALTRAFAPLLGIRIALKLVVTLALLALPLATDRLLRATGGQRAFALLAFPLAYGYTFYWGFLNFVIAVPLGVLFVAHAVRHADRPTRRSAFGLGAFAIVLFFAHALVLGVCGLAGATVVLGRTRSALRTLRAMLPSLLALPPLLLWQTLWLRNDAIPHGTVWSWPGIARFLELPSVLFGPGPDVAGKMFAAGAAALLVLAGVRMRLLRPLGWATILTTLLWVFFPDIFEGVWFVRDRFGVYAAVFVLGTLTLPAARRERTAALAVMVLAAFAWTGVVAWRFAAFDADVRAFERVAAHLPPGASLMKLVLDPYEPRIPGWQRNYLHVPMWYHVEHGGRPGYQFAEYPHELFQYTRRPAWALPPESDWDPARYSYGWISRAPDYRWYVARVSDPVDVALLRHGLPPVRTVARSGSWMLFERTGATGSGSPSR